MNRTKKKSNSYKRKTLPTLIVLICVMLTGKLLGQQEPPDIVTDRPDITESGVTVDPGIYQFEDGFIFENQSGSAEGYDMFENNYTLSTLLVRIGVVKKLELRIGGDYLYQTVKSNNVQVNNSGFTNLMIGAKYQFMSEDLNGADFGLLLQFYLPAGNVSFRPENFEPEFIIAAGKSLTESLSISLNIGTHWDSAANIPVFLYSSSFGFNLSDSWDSFVEIFGEVSAHNSISGNFDFGFAFRPIKNLQIDVSAGNESLSNFNNWFIGSGVSVRLPH
jgi:hypothetical protein